MVLTYVLLVFGSTVRVHGAGLSCPDWPLCFGRLVPEYDFKVYLEFGHRVWAGGVSLGFLTMGALAWRAGSFTALPSLRRAYGLAVIALGAQVVLGGLTVLHLLAEWTVAGHLITGNTFCALLLWCALELGEAESAPRRDPVPVLGRGLALVLLLLVPSQLVLGGLVSSSGAGLACAEWPGCNGGPWFPSFAGALGLQVMHRLMAYTVLVVAAASAFALRGTRAGRAAAMVAALVLLQASIGIVNVLLRLPVEITLAHSAGAAAVFLSTTWTVREVLRAPVAATVSDGLPAAMTPEAR